MAKVVTTFVSDDKQMAASIEKMNAQFTKLKEEMKKLSDESKGQAKQATVSMESLAGFATKAISFYSVLTAGVNTYNREMAASIELQRKAADVQKGIAGGEREFLLNLGIVKGIDRNKAMQGIRDISAKTGVGQSTAYTIGSEALSASGGNLDRALAATELAARVAPHDAPTAEAIASAMLHLEKATGTQDPKKNLSALIGLGQVSAVSKWEFLANNLTPGAIGVSGFGGKPEETFGLLATMANAMGDKRGDQAKTASIALAESLEKFMPEKDLYDYTGGKKKLQAKGTGLASTAERIAAIQADPELMAKFFGTPGVSFEKQAVIPVRRMLTGGSDAANMLAANTKEFRGILGSDQSEPFLQSINNTPLQNTAQMERGANQIIERQYMDASEKARYGIVAAKTDELLASIEYGPTQRFIKRQRIWANSFGNSPAESAMPVLEEAEFLARGQANAFKFEGKTALAKERAGDADSVRELIDTLKKIEQNQRNAGLNNNVEGR